jgi:hypothetical protein
MDFRQFQKRRPMKFALHVASLALSAAFFVFTQHGALAQTYPDKAIRLIVPFPPGGPADILSRAIGQKLTDSWSQPVVIDNRAGAGGGIGSDLAAKAAADGYTLLMGFVGTHAINPSLYTKLPYDNVKSFEPVSLVATATIILVLHPSVNAKTVAELISLAKSKRAYFRLAWQWHATAFGRGIIQHHGRRQDGAHSVQRRSSGDQRSARRSNLTHIQQRATSAAPRQDRKTTSAGGDERQALNRSARSPDNFRSRTVGI